MQARSLNKLGRVVAATAAALTTTVVLVGVVDLFAEASRTPWLRDTPMARKAVAECTGRAGRTERERCVLELAAAAQARDAAHARQASAAASERRDTTVARGP